MVNSLGNKAMNDDQLLRYSRQIMLPDVDIEGQERLLASHALIIGLGGLGSPVAMYLAAAGVGELTLVDFDAVDLSNLQRQIVHTSACIGVNKAQSAAQTLSALNPDITIHVVDQLVDSERLQQLVAEVNLVLDCTDNFATRFAINAACVAARVPLVSGAAIRLEGQVTVFDARQPNSPCYRCLYEESADDLTCAANGVIAPLVGVIGSLQALEALKLLGGFGESLVGRLQLFDARTGQWREMKLRRDPSCPVCSADVAPKV